MANISTSNVTFGSSVVSASSYNTASVSPSANVVYLLAVSATAGTNTIPTVTGAGMTWTQVDSQNINNIGTLTVFRAISASPSSGALTIDFGGHNQDRVGWILDSFANTRITGSNGANAIVQTAKNVASSGTSLTATLSAFANSANATYSAAMNQSAGLGRTNAAGTGFTETKEVDTSDSFMALSTNFRNDNDTSADFTASGSIAHLGIVAIELANVSTETSGTPFLLNFI